jgi:hypothetical protein
MVYGRWTMADKKTMTLNLTDAEMEALEDLCRRKDLSKTREALFRARRHTEEIRVGDPMTERSSAYLFHRQQKEVVEVVLVDGVERGDVAKAQEAWHKLLKQTKSEHAHWDWNQKYQLVAEAPLAYRILGLEAEGQMQGMMLVLTAGKFCRIESQKGKPLVYVDYLATAPWNSADVVAEPIYAGVGKVLIRAAIQLSIEEELQGRIGLHSLPQAESYYRDSCKMTDLGEDKAYYGLKYFETTPEQSASFMRG